MDLVYWRDARKTGVVFSSSVVLLLSLALFSLLSVVAYLSLVTLTVTISYRVYRSILASLQKTGEGHPFQSVSRFILTGEGHPFQSVSRFILTGEGHPFQSVSRFILDSERSLPVLAIYENECWLNSVLVPR